VTVIAAGVSVSVVADWSVDVSTAVGVDGNVSVGIKVGICVGGNARVGIIVGVAAWEQATTSMENRVKVNIFVPRTGDAFILILPNIKRRIGRI
jgi:hypothetical protein